MRTCWRNPGVLDDQLSAIAQAAAAKTADVWFMAPMVSTVAETEGFVNRCHVHGLTPAGVGTNDLTEYVMAADRLLADLAVLSSSWALPVLQLVAATCRAGALWAVQLGCAERPQPIPRWRSCLSVSGSRPCR